MLGSPKPPRPRPQRPSISTRTFNINARGVFFTVQKALPLMTRGGSIVLISSGLHSKGFPEHAAYSATKAAVRSFARTWAAEFKDRGIRVNTLSPGPVDTPIIDRQFATKEEADATKALFARMNPLGRIGRPEEIATAALFPRLPTRAAFAPAAISWPMAASPRSDRGCHPTTRSAAPLRHRWHRAEIVAPAIGSKL